MATWFSSIALGIKVYAMAAAFIALPYEVIKTLTTKRINLLKLVLNQITLLYFICVFTVCFFPLPTFEEALELTYRIQAIPFYFAGDVIKNFSLEAVCQVLFNVALTVPFGAVLRYKAGFSIRKATVLSLALSVLIEVGQLTGLFFMFNGSYRLCDVDDLILNTLGGFIGALVASRIEGKLPTLSAYELVIINSGRKALVD